MGLKQGLDGSPLTAQEAEALEAQLADAHNLYLTTASYPDMPAPAKQKVGTADILAYIRRLLAERRQQGEISCVLASGEIHRAMGLANQMPSVCNAMRKAMEAGDEVVHTTSGNSSTIQIRYQD